MFALKPFLIFVVFSVMFFPISAGSKVIVTFKRLLKVYVELYIVLELDRITVEPVELKEALEGNCKVIVETEGMRFEITH